MSALPVGYEKVTCYYPCVTRYVTKSGELKEYKTRGSKSYIRKNPLKQATRDLIGTLSSEQLFKVNQFIKGTLKESENSGSDSEPAI